MSAQPVTNFDVRVPGELEAGAYANFMSVWHTPYEFTLDFAVTQPPQMTASEGNDPGRINVPCRVVARVKIPPTMIFDVLRTLNENMTNFENTFGPIQRPGEKQHGGTD